MKVNPVIQFRKDQGMTVREFAKAIGVSRSMVSEVEQGRIKDFSGFMRKIHRAFPTAKGYIPFHSLGLCNCCGGTGQSKILASKGRKR